MVLKKFSSPPPLVLLLAVEREDLVEVAVEWRDLISLNEEVKKGLETHVLSYVTWAKTYHDIYSNIVDRSRLKMALRSSRLRNQTGLSSQKVQQLGSTCNQNGRRLATNTLAGPKVLSQCAARAQARKKQRLEAMTLEQRQALQALVERHDGADNDASMDFSSDFNDILRGDQCLEISHSGGELEDLAQEIMGDFWKGTTPKSQGPRQNDHRTRRDRIQRRADAFDAQLPAITEAYLDWSLQRVQSGTRPGFFHQMAKDALNEVEADSGSWTATVISGTQNKF
ncbi:hypothetical protein EV702DRAFT_1248949 [Suillus placidus]|uniref:Uncharacterized protein n=1 Tax=Suillus placidus TaxID=48579 RepID=A0A9P6ZL39_9AGAM|nr:hypothetical protein EV702DRAFT_1248949 [Suillus placidus]